MLFPVFLAPPTDPIKKLLPLSGGYYRTFPVKSTFFAILQGVEKRHERRQDKAKFGEKAESMFDK